jgi:gamma-glutamylcyclotransferase (GGCT)/AIG2-like uncharacterized protein YtfP
MTIINSYIFVYGTLLMQDNQYAKYLNQHCRFIGDGKISGLLYDVGEYPAAIIATTPNQYIYGSIYLMDDAESVLPVIDEYEGLSDNNPQPWEYARSLVDIETADGLLKCWMYIYNWSVDGMATITGGDYQAYLQQK